MTGGQPMDARFRGMVDALLEGVANGDTVVVATAEGGKLVAMVECTRPRDLVDIARTLLDQAVERLDMATGAVGLPEVRLFHAARRALQHLPDPHAEDLEDQDPA